jgi:YgiT-type zinc finger domain-containing protein
MEKKGAEKDFVEASREMYERLCAWRKAHPGATFDEIAEAIRKEREELTGRLVGELAVQEQKLHLWEEAYCPTCGEKARYKGKRRRQVVHKEGVSTLERPYYSCPHCGEGFFPLG